MPEIGCCPISRRLRWKPDEMFRWLETAYANRDPGLVRIFVIPSSWIIGTIRVSPPFAASSGLKIFRASHEQRSQRSPEAKAPAA
jgi:hypothetical protein